jgi:hypothetical protein
MLSGPSPGQRSAVPVLGTALRVLKEIFVHPPDPSSPSHSWNVLLLVFPYHCFLVASLSTPPDFHLPFFNLHARKFSGVMCRTTLSKPPLNVADWVEFKPLPSLWNIHPFKDSS